MGSSGAWCVNPHERWKFPELLDIIELPARAVGAKAANNAAIDAMRTRARLRMVPPFFPAPSSFTPGIGS